MIVLVEAALGDIEFDDGFDRYEGMFEAEVLEQDDMNTKIRRISDNEILIVSNGSLRAVKNKDGSWHYRRWD